METIFMSVIKTIGVMTGNSLDAVDVVLTAFDGVNICDLAAHTLAYPAELSDQFRRLRGQLKQTSADMESFARDTFFSETVNEYTSLVARAVNELLARSNTPKDEVDAIGFHGQTCDHFPPSIAGDLPPYTLQIGNPNLLADLTGVPVIYDFRSDDLMNGGEGAPLAPMHNFHLAASLREKGVFPVAFCNGGNTGNIALISQNGAGKDILLGWDVGPFNHFADTITRTCFGAPYDKDGRYGKKGRVQTDLLDKLFNQTAVSETGENFYLSRPPKSSDPSWYRLPDISGYQAEDVLRTVEYLSSYVFFHSLSYIPEDVMMPEYFLLFGGGWNNPLMTDDFTALLHGGENIVLPQHRALFERMRSRFAQSPHIARTDRYGISGQYMEAGILADLARCKIKNIPFTTPETTGCKTPTVCGIWCYPHDRQQPLYNRAAPGWHKKIPG